MPGSATLISTDERVGKLFQWATTFKGKDDAQMAFLINRALGQSRDVSQAIQSFCRRQAVYPGIPADYEQITTDLEQLLEQQTDAQHSLARADTLLALAEARVLSGESADVKKARQHLDGAVKICEEVNDGHRVTEIHIVAAKVTLAEGKLSEAVMHLEQAARFATTFPPTSVFSKSVAALMASAQAPNQFTSANA